MCSKCDPQDRAGGSSKPDTAATNISVQLVKILELINVEKGFTLAKMPHFFYKDLEEGTKGFSQANLLGEGTFGRVFRANVFKTIFAVKCLRQNNEDITQERNGRKFQFNELAKLMQFRHPNLLPLHGYSADGMVPCLVTEYMHNGSLEDRLQCKDRTAGLKWELRMNITKGVARGLQFLHTVKDPPLIHGDIKSSNILLDRHYEAKIGDFGLARDGPGGSLRSYTIMKTGSKLMGTTAYMAPEYCRNKVLSREVDTYAFGVVVFEILTGQKAFDETRGKNTRVLTDLVMEHMETNDPDLTLKLVDKKTGRTSWPRETALGLFEIGRQCTLHKRKQRPKMTDVLSRLEQMEVRRQLSKEGVSLMSSLASSPDLSRRTRQEPQESDSPSLASGSPIVGPSPHLANQGSPILGSSPNLANQGSPILIRPSPHPLRQSSHEPIESDELAWSKEDNKTANRMATVGHCVNPNVGQLPVERATSQPSYPSQSTISTDLGSSGVVSHQQNVENLAGPPAPNKEDNNLPLPSDKQLKDEGQGKGSLKKEDVPPSRPVQAWMPDSIMRNTDGEGAKSATQKTFPPKDVSKMSPPSRHLGGRKLSPCESDDCASMSQQPSRQSPVEFHAKADTKNVVKPQVNQPASNIPAGNAAVKSSEKPAGITPNRAERQSAGRNGVTGRPGEEHQRQHLPVYPPGYNPPDNRASDYAQFPNMGRHWGYPQHQNQASVSTMPQNGQAAAFYTPESHFYGVSQPYMGQPSPAMAPTEVPYLPPNYVPYGYHPQYPPQYDVPPSQSQRADMHQDPYPQYIAEAQRLYPHHPPSRFQHVYPPSPDSSCSNQRSTTSSSSSSSQSSISRDGSSSCTTFTDTSSGLSSETKEEPSSSGAETSSMSLPEVSSSSSSNNLSLPPSDERSFQFSPNAARDRLVQDIEDYSEGRIDSKQCFENVLAPQNNAQDMEDMKAYMESRIDSEQPSENESLAKLSLGRSESVSSREPTEDSDDSTSC
ncbi:Interleukin-1 receptor-associated kinase 1 [Branchiostoma belcheri]|nr:Interleukin-1 receptor-associated kinase 1 [Branchiostoma belcheri]